MRKCIALFLVLVMTVSALACAAKPAANDKPEAGGAPATAGDPAVVLVYAEENPQESLAGKVATMFAEEVARLSGGSVTVDVHYSGVLGAAGDVLDTMIGGSGTIDVARISTSNLTSYGVKLTTLLSVPYVIESREHFWTFAKSDLGAAILREPSELGLGIRGLTFVEEGFRNFFFAKEIKGLSDLAGTKIRVSSDAIMTGTVEGLKASPTVVAFNELYTSLSSGVVDGAEQPIANYQSNAFYEVAPYMILDGHTLSCQEILMTDAAWAKLSGAQQDAVMEACRLVSEFSEALSQQNEDECKAELIEKGVTFVEVADIKEWQDACANIIAQSIVGLENEYQAILDLAD